MHGHTTHFLLLLFFIFIFIHSIATTTILPSQAGALLRLRPILGYPPSLSPLSSTPAASLCSLPATPTLSLVCTDGRVTSLSISGTDLDLFLSPFTSDSLFTTLVQLNSLSSLSLTTLGLNAPLPDKLRRLTSLRVLNLSSNHLSGPFPAFLLALPGIQSIDLSNNNFSGEVPSGAICNPGLRFVSIANNRLVGELPPCMTTAITNSSGNCLSGSTYQQPNSYCNEGGLAAVLPPVQNDGDGKKDKLVLVVSVTVVAGAIMIGILFAVFALRRVLGMHLKIIVAGTDDLVKISPRTPGGAKMKMDDLGLNPYRVFTMEEIQEATDFFDQSHLFSDGSGFQCYRGWISDGSAAVFRILKLSQKYPTKSIIQYMDAVSKLRHRHLVCILGHCIFEDTPNFTDTIFLVLEHISVNNLRNHLTEGRKGEMLKWTQRVAAVIGIARGIQFLHTVTLPGIARNNLKIQNILLDETLTAKISNHSLPILTNNTKKPGCESPFVEDGFSSIQSIEQAEKEDIYQLGLILLELITGKPAESTSQFEDQIHQLRKALNDNPLKLRALTDPAMNSNLAYGSLRTAVEVTLNCLSKDPKERPSVDDILWNLEYSMQLQEGWIISENLSISRRSY